MEVGILGETVYVSSGEQLWLLNPAEDAAERAKELGIEPTAVLLTKMAAPGLSKLEKMPVVVRIPLRMGELMAVPEERAHGWDYVIKEIGADDSLLYTLRGDVSVADIELHTAAVIGNKYRAGAFTDAVITQPWADTTSLTVGKHKPGGVDHDQSRHAGSRGGAPSADAKAQVADMKERAAAAEGEREEMEISQDWALMVEDHLGVDDKASAQHVYDNLATDPMEIPNSRKRLTKFDSEFGGPPKSWEGFEDAWEGQLGLSEKEQHKEWSNLAAVPDQVKKHQDTPLSLAQANHVARIADGIKSAGGAENEWAAAWAQFTGLYKKSDGVWVRKQRQKKEELPEAIVALLDEVQLLPGQIAFKEQPDGRYRWYSLTATDTWDLQEEQITPQALDWSLAVSTILKDRGPLLYRHLPLPMGGCDKQVRAGPLLFESGLTDSTDENPVTRAAVKAVFDEPGRWSISPGLRFKEGDLVDGVYSRCWIYERSLTHSPANPTASFTLGGTEMKVTQDMLKEAAEELGLPVEQLEALAKTYLDQDKEYEDMQAALKEIAAKAAADMSEDEDDEEGKGRKRGKRGDEEEEEEEANAEKELRELIANNTAAMQEVAKALTSLSQPNTAAKEDITAAVEAFLAKVPRNDAAEFATDKEGSNKGDGSPETLQGTLLQMQKQLDTLTAGNGPALRSFEQMFTSTDLNPGGAS